MTLDELDKLAARMVMGWTWDARFNRYEIDPDVDRWVYNWEPTENIAQAFECLEKFPAFQLFCRYPQANPRYECVLYTGELNSINPETVIIVEAKSAPEAIVRACLRAKGVEV